MHPRAAETRNSPISAVLLTNADLDHVLGLFLLRESSALRVYAPEAIFQVVARDLHLVEILQPFCRVEWLNAPLHQKIPLLLGNGMASGLQIRALPLSTKPPPFALASPTQAAQSVAYEITDERTQGRLIVAPDVESITPELLQAMSEADAILFDGTFWSEQELTEATGKARTAQEMGHLTIRDGSLKVLQGLKARRKMYLHINNTNPILDPHTPEHGAVKEAGLMVGYDGFEFEL